MPPAEVPDIQWGPGIDPQIYDGRINFLVTISAEEKSALHPTHGRGSMAGHVFRVYIEYKYDLPIVIVESLDSHHGPSGGVMVVRDWLRAKLENSAIQLQTIGPTPFHADFYLVAQRAATSPEPGFIGLNRRSQRGYDELRFSFGPADMTEAQAYEQLIEDLTDELDVYYSVVSSSHDLLQRGLKADELTWNAVARQNARGLRAWLARPFTLGSAVSSAFVALAELESASSMTRESLEDMVESMYPDGYESRYLRADVERELRDLPRHPTSESRTPAQPRRTAATEWTRGTGPRALSRRWRLGGSARHRHSQRWWRAHSRSGTARPSDRLPHYCFQSDHLLAGGSQEHSPAPVDVHGCATAEDRRSHKDDRTLTLVIAETVPADASYKPINSPDRAIVVVV